MIAFDNIKIIFSMTYMLYSLAYSYNKIYNYLYIILTK